ISSSIISWHRLMHSSQMYTPWPAISLRTCSWLLPQKLQRYGTLGPFAPLVDVTRAVLVPLRIAVRGSSLGRRRSVARRIVPARAVVRRGRRPADLAQRIPGVGVHRVDDAIVPRLLGRHEIVPVRVAPDLFDRLAGVVGEDLMEPLVEGFQLLDLDEHVGRVATEAARALVDHDPAVRQRVALALGAGGKEHRRHARGHAQADG